MWVWSPCCGPVRERVSISAVIPTELSEGTRLRVGVLTKIDWRRLSLLKIARNFFITLGDLSDYNVG